jgi:hypothetical protein
VASIRPIQTIIFAIRAIVLVEKVMLASRTCVHYVIDRRIPFRFKLLDEVPHIMPQLHPAYRHVAFVLWRIGLVWAASAPA